MKRIFLGAMVLMLFMPTFAQGWVARYNGPSNHWDLACAIAVDNSGNVYVTGKSYDSLTSFDYATIKYNLSGDEVWVRRYNGPPGNDFDEATAIAVDGAGNVYVTGTSVGPGTGHDYATIKYHSSGDIVWVRRYNEPSNGNDYAKAMAVDGFGNVYVTGYSESSGFSYATIKYNPSGDEVWVRRYNGPGNGDDYATAIAVDDSGNAYVTGYSLGSGTSSDYATIKYTPSGDIVWVRRYNGPGNSWDRATAIAVDGAGNVYVTGTSGVSRELGTYYDYATIKYNSSGVEQWVRGEDELVCGNDDYATAIALDGVGNAYVTGESAGPGTGYDYLTLQYNSSKEHRWGDRYNGPGNGKDCATAIAVDVNGNVYVTGTSKGSGTSSDYATIKYTPSGNIVWVRRYNGPGNCSDNATAIAVDGAGNVYVTGTSNGSGTPCDYATIKYSAKGME